MHDGTVVKIIAIDCSLWQSVHLYSKATIRLWKAERLFSGYCQGYTLCVKVNLNYNRYSHCGLCFYIFYTLNAKCGSVTAHE